MKGERLTAQPTVDTHPRYIATKFEVNLDDGFGEEVENVNCGRRTTDDRQTDDGRRTILKAQLTDVS